MKKILYDHQMFTFQRFGGVTRYFADLMYNLPQNLPTLGERVVAAMREMID